MCHKQEYSITNSLKAFFLKAFTKRLVSILNGLILGCTLETSPNQIVLAGRIYSKCIVMEFLLMGINQTVKLRFKMYALYVFSLVVR